MPSSTRPRLLGTASALVAFLVLAPCDVHAQTPIGQTGTGVGVGVGTGVTLDIETIKGKRRPNRFPMHYSTKFLCGTIPPDATAPPNPPLQFPAAGSLLFSPGSYFTDLEVLNNHRRFVQAEITAVATSPDEGEARLNPVPTAINLSGFSAREFGCIEILLAAGLSGADINLEEEFVKGWVVIRTRPELEVMAVYTLKNVDVIEKTIISGGGGGDGDGGVEEPVN